MAMKRSEQRKRSESEEKAGICAANELKKVSIANELMKVSIRTRTFSLTCYNSLLEKLKDASLSR